ncbi:MAG TPA: GWxTD domain-containing protein [Pyrinomonadaceae bacterium]|nr:GWxTD domain-containing protein [Pyrinomonadaceae bacterium]
MRTKGMIRLCLAIVLCVNAFATALAQEGRKEQLVVPMRGGYFVTFSTAPGSDTDGQNGWSTTFAEAYFESNTIRRVFVDDGGSMYFGYALVIEPLAASGQFRVSARPLSPEDEQELRARKSFQTRTIHPNYNAAGFSRSAPQIISDGDTFALDVLVNPKTGDKVTDFVTVSANESTARETSVRSKVAPRDFTLEDVEMKMINYQLLVNNELVAGGKRSGACAGPVIWFHLQERGRFIFSLKPHEGYDFQKIGTIERNKIKFKLGDDRYEWISDVPVVSGGGPWNLYVLYDPNYVPDSFFLGVNGVARGENDKSSGPNAVERVMRMPKKAQTQGFGKSPGSQKDDKDDKAVTPRLIIGAASRVENLLPVNTGAFAQSGLRPAYAQWLYKDVAYIITPEEAWAFKQLKTDEERERFIEQFWRMRDTLPATPENEYRKEHYDRIVHANETFGFGDVPGWRTDRGRIYIMYGKPDEVQTGPTRESWLYKTLPALGANILIEFVDESGTGELRLLKPKTP